MPKNSTEEGAELNVLLEKEYTSDYVASIVAEFLKNVPTNQSNPRAVLMFGFPGSGKTTLQRRRERDGHLIIDVDECLACMPAFWSGVLEAKSGDWVFEMRSDARKIAERLLDEAIQRRVHFVWNGLGRSFQQYKQLVERLREAEYEIEACGVQVKSSTARKRMKAREKKFKRPVPRRVLVESIGTVHTNFNRIRAMSDYARVWTTEDDSPKIIWDKDHGIQDTKRWFQWNNPSPLPKYTPRLDE